MGQMSNVAICKQCEKNGVGTHGTYSSGGFYVIIEWLPKEEAIALLKETKCPECGSDDWYFSDEIDR